LARLSTISVLDARDAPATIGDAHQLAARASVVLLPVSVEALVRRVLGALPVVVGALAERISIRGDRIQAHVERAHLRRKRDALPVDAGESLRSAGGLSPAAVVAEWGSPDELDGPVWRYFAEGVRPVALELTFRGGRLASARVSEQPSGLR
jgi:hypothetical protein